MNLLLSIISQRRRTPDVLWTPDLLGASLALWLDANDAITVILNGSNVSAWNDKSGNARNFLQVTAGSRPLYLPTGFNSKPTIQTDGGDSLLLGVSSLGRNVSGLTAAIVGVYPVGATFLANASDLFFVGGGPTRFVMTPNPSASTANRYGFGGRRLDTDGFATASSATNSITNLGNPWIRIAQRAYSDGVGHHWTNGTQDLTGAVFGTQGAGNTSDTNSNIAQIFGGVANLPANSQISEVVLTHSTMVNDDRQKLEGYLAHKWGLTASLPLDHPYKTTAPTA